MIRAVNLLILILVLSGATFSQTPSPKSNVCNSPVETPNQFPVTEPVIFGKPYLVPKLKVQLLDKYTNKPFAGAEVTVNYVWEWLEYPYTEAPFGAWSEGNYSATCYANEGGIVEIEEYKVEPHGWYKGIYSIGRKPRFLNVRVGYELPYVKTKEKHCHTYTEITKMELDKCKRSGKCEFTIKDSCPLDWK